MKCIRVYEVYSQPGYDALFKVRKYSDLITPNLESEYNPHEPLSVDEAMIPFKGRLGFKQYMKDKPTKGVRVHTSLSMRIEFALEPVRERPHIMRIERMRIQSGSSRSTSGGGLNAHSV